MRPKPERRLPLKLWRRRSKDRLYYEECDVTVLAKLKAIDGGSHIVSPRTGFIARLLELLNA
jgi:hypothetical protein